MKPAKRPTTKQPIRQSAYYGFLLRLAADLPKTRLLPLWREVFARSSCLGRDWTHSACATLLRALDFEIFEVDHPATQAWKRKRLTLAGLHVEPSVAFVSVDLTEQSLDECLAVAGFEPGASAFFSWLGGVQYMARSAIDAVLQFIAKIPNSEVVFDYVEPIENYPPERRARVVAMSERAAAQGEPWLCYFNPAEIAGALKGLGFTELEDIDPATMSLRYFETLKEKVIGGPGPHVMRAKR